MTHTPTPLEKELMGILKELTIFYDSMDLGGDFKAIELWQRAYEVIDKAEGKA